jgi:S-adenosylmethionine synthetase
MWGRNSNKLSMGCQREFGEDVSCVYDINSVGIIRAQHEKRLNVAMPWIEKYQENYFNYLFPREACINAVKAMVANLNDSEVEGLFPPLPPKPEPLSTLKVKTEGVIAE